MRCSNVEIGAKVSENMVDEISKFKKEVKFIYEEMNRPYYKSNAKNDPCGAKVFALIPIFRRVSVASAILVMPRAGCDDLPSSAEEHHLHEFQPALMLVHIYVGPIIR